MRNTRLRARWVAGVITLLIQFICARAVFAQTGTWSNALALPQATFGTSLVAANGQLYALGGNTASCTSTASVLAYNPASNAWTAKASLSSPLTGVTAVNFNGNIYAIGGGSGCATTGTNRVAVYNPVANSWTTKNPFPFAIRSAGAAVANATLYVLGGEVNGNAWTNTVYAYNPTNDTWALVSTLPAARSLFACAAANNIIYMIGGQVASSPSPALWAFHPATTNWTTNQPMPVYLQQPGAATLDGLIFVAGGATNGATASTVVEAYNPLSNSWSMAPSLLTAITSGGCAALNGELYVAGGENLASAIIANLQALAVILPPSIITPPFNLAVTNGQTATFSVTATGSPAPGFQWLKNGVALAGMNSAVLTLNAASAANAGFYSVVVNNTGGAVTSAPVLLTVLAPDKTLPTVTVTSPTANQKTTSASVTLTGTAKSALGLAAVWYQLNGQGWVPAASSNNWSNWTASLTLAPYLNSIQVCAEDTAGGLSAIKIINVTYAEYAAVTVTTGSGGTTLPAYNGQMLEVGKSYVITAKPNKGQAFSGWTETTNSSVFAASSSRTLSFVMQPGLQLTASFAAPTAASLSTVLSVSATNVAESGSFTVTATVNNNSTAMVRGLHVDAEAFNLDAGYTGFAVPLKFISPVIASLGGGKSVVFKQTFKATTAGTFRFYCVIDSSLGVGSTNYSPAVTVFQSRPGFQPLSDSSGHAKLAAGGVSLPINLYDEETGSTLSGMALGLALDPGRKGQAVLAAVDTAGRYPPQFFLLHGAAAPTELSARRIESGTPVDSTTLVRSAGIPIDQPCGGSAFQHIMTPIQTTALPPLAPLTEPPGVQPDKAQPAMTVLLDALASAGAAAKNFVISKKVVDCSEVLADDAAGLAAGKAVDVIFGEAPEHFLSEFAPGTAGIYTAFMAADTANSYYQAYRDVGLCHGLSGEGVVLQTTLLPQVKPYLETSFMTWNSPVASDNTPLPLVLANVQTVDQNGNPISGGSIEMFSANHLGSGFRGVIENGSADLPVLANDDYTLCARAPGYVTQSGQVTVGASDTNILLMLPPQPVHSAALTSALGQPTGLLKKGTQFVLTPHFYDTNGVELTCTGQPMFYVRNPVGSTVATVDPSSGLVTIGDGCGAALVYVWCNGIESAPKLVSSDCNGSQPPTASSTFAVSPTALAFSAVEGKGNPGSQSVYIVGLIAGGAGLTIQPSRSWITVVGGSGYVTVGVNTAGLGAGTYGGVIKMTDTNAPSNTASVSVTLVITGTSGGGGAGHAFDGSWSGNYTGPYTYTGGSMTTESGQVDVLILNGVLTADSPVSGSAIMDGSGNVTWTTTDSGETPFVFTGTFTKAGTASGTWTLTIPTSNPGQSGSGSGTWSAVRTFP